MEKHIGEYIREEVRKQGLSDQDVAGFLNITKSSVEKIWMRGEMYASRIEKFCELLNKDMFAFYYEKEPLKSIHHNILLEFEKTISDLKKVIAEKDEMINDKKKIIEFLKQSSSSANELKNESPGKSEADKKHPK